MERDRQLAPRGLLSGQPGKSMSDRACQPKTNGAQVLRNETKIEF